MLKTLKMYRSNAQLLENVEYEKRHCKLCASSVPGSANDCPQRGTFHGEKVSLFQENKHAMRMLKSGELNPNWINQWYAPLLAPFLGRYADSKQISNLITNAGRGLISGLLNGSGSPATPTYIAVGTGTTAASTADTALQTETATSGLSRAAATVSLVTTSVTNDTAQWSKTFTVTGSVAVTESGVLNAASVGTLLCRQVFSAINVANGDSLQVIWKVQNT